MGVIGYIGQSESGRRSSPPSSVASIDEVSSVSNNSTFSISFFGSSTSRNSTSSSVSSLESDHHPLLADESGCQQPQKIVISTTTSVTQFNWTRIALVTFFVVVLVVIVFAIGLFLGMHVTDDKSTSIKGDDYGQATSTSFHAHNKHFVPIREDEPPERLLSPKLGVSEFAPKVS